MKKKRKLSYEESEIITDSILKGSLDEFKCLFTRDFHFNAVLYQGSSPIHVAAQLDRLDIIDFLLASGVDGQKTDKNGWTPLHYAVKNSTSAVISRLIKTSVKFKCSYALFFNTSYDQSRKGINKKIYVKSNLNVRNSEGNTPLHIACKRKNEEVVRLLLNAYEEIPETKRKLSIENKLGNTPLHVACHRSNEAVVSLLLNALENISVAKRNLCFVNKRQDTPLHLACESGDEAVVRHLLKALEKVPVAKRNLSTGNKFGNTPLHIACDGENEKVASLLLNYLEKIPTSNLTVVNSWGSTPLHIACRNGNSRVVYLLLNALEKVPETERDLSKVNHSGETPLYVACKLGYELHVKLLLNAIEKIPKTMHNLNENSGFGGNTPLHVACEKGDMSIVSLLLNAGADSDIVNKHGEKALSLYLPKQRRLGERESAVLEKMSSFTDINNNKMSALHSVLKLGCEDLKTITIILRFQKNLNVLDIWGDTPLNYLTNHLEKDLANRIIKIKLLINHGAYFTPKDCKRIVSNYFAQYILFTDVELCAESCLNKLVDATTSAMSNSSLSNRLPPKDRLVSNSAYLPKLKALVETEIKCRGYCDFQKILYPLFYLSVVRLSNHVNRQIPSSRVKYNRNRTNNHS